ncbi:aromatic ring-hydroxylating oxygenase subunit alpha [Metapseudomonas boanensis]|uniref:Aromatic ring-hydroxylating dioxygenase subunit alpha n=1 Tax=Metapseudomonas boanensis TaxID=2822138 RepID=A0ABS5XGB4_9GAMM|nr:aromatic ring-hydroxylating dioxygenase subunit alpha [Pseudomonas boanensis]MBT8766736.1 aromatic ring-hydroxylating dioxygenase subunit alpha [Pseudomonas boanensis]
MLPEKKLDVAVSEAVSQRLVTHLREDTTDLAEHDLFVPVADFVSPERAAAEVALLKSLPTVVAHASEIRNNGDFLTREILDMPLLIVRQTDGRAQVYLNMCRHRGGRVEQAATGNKRVFMCQYHGWSYDRDGGGLRTVPYESSFEKIERGCNSLIAFPTEERHGLVFAVLSQTPAPALADYLGDAVDEQMAPWQLDASSVVLDKTFVMDINWKLIMDGAIDIIHPRFLHPGGVGDLIESNVGVFKDYGRHCQHFGARTKLKALAKSEATVSGGSKYIGSNLVIYPNSMMIAAPEHVEFWTVWPCVGHPGRSLTHLRFLVRDAILDDALLARVNKSWEILQRAATEEDWPMERFIQQNAEAWPHGTYRYGRSEVACAHLHRQLQSDLDEAARKA